MLGRADGGADLVLASVHGGGQMVNVSPLRRVPQQRAPASSCGVALGLDAHTVSSLLPRLPRLDAAARASTRYGDDLIRERGFACKAELLAKLAALGARIEEVPVDLDGSRRVGESKMSILPTLAGYWRLFARRGSTREEAHAA